MNLLKLNAKFNAFNRQGVLEECKTFFSATSIALLVFASVYTYDAYATTSTQQNTLTVTIAPAVTFNVSTDSFGTLTPGSYKFATSTTVVTTNVSAWNVALYGNNTGSTTASTTLYIAADTATDNKIPDGAGWSVADGTATTTANNAIALTGAENFLYFRVMTASGTAAFRSTTWWGSDDTAFTNARWAGIASSTAAQLVGRKIGKTSIYQSGSSINSVQYYLNVAASQKQGSYTGNLTYTWTDSL